MEETETVNRFALYKYNTNSMQKFDAKINLEKIQIMSF